MDDCLLYQQPELYDLLFPGPGRISLKADDVRQARIVASQAFYLEEARRNRGSVLDVACGSGRLTVPLARAGVDITGVDISESMLAAARAKAAVAAVPVRFHLADMRNFELPILFSTILIPGNSLLHLLTVEDLLACLANVRRHLTADGRLVFDISKWDPHVLARPAGTRYRAFRVSDAALGEITAEEASDYDAARQIRHTTLYLSAPGRPDFRVFDYQLRVIFPEELRLLLDAAGFQFESRYGEFPRVPFAPDSPRQVCCCSLK
jgi:SAM-dependent methyltransferase